MGEQRMIIVESIIGNKNSDWKLKKQCDELSKRGACEVITISRFESQRTRMRKVSDKGTDIAISLPLGKHIRNGDILVMTEEKSIVIEISPEKVISISIKEENISLQKLIEISVRIGHTIGNLHRPLRIEKNKIYFPIQSDMEVEMFTKLFDPIVNYVQLSTAIMVFEPTTGTDVHEH
jgi:urease accessory protein